MNDANKNKPNSNPISSKAKMNVNSLITKDYRKKDDFAVRKNKPKQSQFFSCPNPPASLSRPIKFPASFGNNAGNIRRSNGIFTFYFIRYTQYDICNTQKHPANRVNRSYFAEKA